MKLLLFLYLALWLGLTRAARLVPIQNVFGIPFGTQRGSCQPYMSQLTSDWQAIWNMNEEVLKVLQEDTLYTEKHWNTLKLGRAFLNLNYDVQDGKIKPPRERIDKEKWSKAIRWYKRIQVFMSTPNVGVSSPRLFCNSNIYQLQNERSPMRNINGQIMKHRNGSPVLLPEYILRYMDRDYILSKTWWHYMDLPTGDPRIREYAYDTASKEDVDEPDFCHPDNEGNAVVLRAGTDNWPFHRASLKLLLCPYIFQDARFLPNLPTQRPGMGTDLKQIAPRALNLYHELFHVTSAEGRSPDAKVVKPRDDNSGNSLQGYENDKTKWESVDRHVSSALDCAYLAAYERAAPVSTDIDALASNKDPETYAWFSYGNWLQETFRGDDGEVSQDWSTTVAKDAEVFNGQLLC